MCSFRLGVRVFSGAFWHLEYLPWQFPSEFVFSPCISSPHVTSRRIFPASPDTYSYKSVIFHEVLTPAAFQFWHCLYNSFPSFPSDSERSHRTCLRRLTQTGLCLHKEWKLKHKLISAPLNRGHALTLSHREPGIINSLGDCQGYLHGYFHQT